MSTATHVPSSTNRPLRGAAYIKLAQHLRALGSAAIPLIESVLQLGVHKL